MLFWDAHDIINSDVPLNLSLQQRQCMLSGILNEGSC